MIAIILTILFLIIFSLIIQGVTEKFPKIALQIGAILEIVFIILIVLSIIVPGSLDAWLR